MRILIAEDDFTSRRMLAALLRKSGHEILEALNGQEALAIMEQADAPKLAILDWMMPILDGIHVVQRIRARPSPQPPYLIMLTSKDTKADIIAGLDAGANDYLSKPFDAGELRARIEVGRRLLEMQLALFESQEALRHQATHDPLTGLLNRRAILEFFHRELSRALRHGDVLGIGMCDIDFFKRINDTYGHQTGDDVLCAIARILCEHVRNYDSVGRMGGEEFLLIVPAKPHTELDCIFSRLCQQIAANPLPTRSGNLPLTISIGVAFASPGRSVDEMLAAADVALYQAKQQGRNRVVREAPRT